MESQPLWLPLGLRAEIDADEYERARASTIPVSPSSAHPDLIAEYHKRLLLYEVSLEGWVDPGFQSTLYSEFVESCVREGYSLTTSFRLAQFVTAPSQSLDLHDFFQRLLAHEANAVRTAIHRVGAELNVEIFVGELPLGCAIAQVERLQSGFLVLVDRSVLLALHIAAKIYVWSWTFTDFGNMRRSEDGWLAKQVTLALAQLAGEYCQRNVTFAPRYRVPAGIRYLMLNVMVAAAERWIIAHEFAHVLNGDFDADNGDIAHLENAADDTATTLLFSDADTSGNDPSGRDFVRFAVAGIALLFGQRELFQKVGKRVFEKMWPDDHVLPLERAQRFRANLVRRFDAELVDAFDTSMKWWSAYIDDVLDHCTWYPRHPEGHRLN